MNLVSELDLRGRLSAAECALDGPPQLGGVEGIYGIDKLLISWSASSKTSLNHGPAPDVS
jgi:hypothetical protein